MLTAVVTDLRWAFRLVRRRPLTSAAVAAKTTRSTPSRAMSSCSSSSGRIGIPSG